MSKKRSRAQGQGAKKRELEQQASPPSEEHQQCQADIQKPCDPPRWEFVPYDGPVEIAGPTLHDITPLWGEVRPSDVAAMQDAIQTAESHAAEAAAKLSRKNKDRSREQLALEREGLTDTEIAKRLDVQVDAVRRRRSREGRRKERPSPN
jgi:hypothetical protein